MYAVAQFAISRRIPERISPTMQEKDVMMKHVGETFYLGPWSVSIQYLSTKSPGSFAYRVLCIGILVVEASARLEKAGAIT